jgi:hypothetical protein
MSDKENEDSKRADSLGRGVCLWCVWGTVAFALVAWLLVT